MAVSPELMTEVTGVETERNLHLSLAERLSLDTVKDPVLGVVLIGAAQRIEPKPGFPPKLMAVSEFTKTITRYLANPDIKPTVYGLLKSGISIIKPAGSVETERPKEAGGGKKKVKGYKPESVLALLAYLYTRETKLIEGMTNPPRLLVYNLTLQRLGEDHPLSSFLCQPGANPDIPDEEVPPDLLLFPVDLATIEKYDLLAWFEAIDRTILLDEFSPTKVSIPPPVIEAIVEIYNILAKEKGKPKIDLSRAIIPLSNSEVRNALSVCIGLFNDYREIKNLAELRNQYDKITSVKI